jgi:hypothetical protein
MSQVEERLGDMGVSLPELSPSMAWSSAPRTLAGELSS